MADIYGTQNSLLLESGLADAENEEDFIVKLACLQAVWDNIAPGFHHLFKKWMSDIFIDCLILNSRGRHGISKLLTTNGLKLKHWLQEKVLTEDEVPKQIVSVSQSLKKWIETYFKEAKRAVIGIGKYRLSPVFSSFYVDPAIWVQWSEERRNQHFKAFVQSAQSLMTYEKPNLAGRKPGNSGNQKRRARLPEPELFEERIIEEEPNEQVTPVKIRRTGNDANAWQVGYYKRTKL